MGGSWFSIFDSLNVLTIGDIAIDPIDTDIIYVGTGEANGGHNNFPGGGVFKSTNAGSTWNFLGLTNTTSIGRIIIHPTNTDVIYLAAVGSYFSPNPERGIYKSTDGGNSWNQSLFISDSTGGNRCCYGSKQSGVLICCDVGACEKTKFISSFWSVKWSLSQC